MGYRVLREMFRLRPAGSAQHDRDSGGEHCPDMTVTVIHYTFSILHCPLSIVNSPSSPVAAGFEVVARAAVAVVDGLPGDAAPSG